MNKYVAIPATNLRENTLRYGMVSHMAGYAMGMLVGIMVASDYKDIEPWEVTGLRNESKFLGGDYRGRHCEVIV